MAAAQATRQASLSTAEVTHQQALDLAEDTYDKKAAAADAVFAQQSLAATDSDAVKAAQAALTQAQNDAANLLADPSGITLPDTLTAPTVTPTAITAVRPDDYTPPWALASTYDAVYGSAWGGPWWGGGYGYGAYWGGYWNGYWGGPGSAWAGSWWGGWWGGYGYGQCWNWGGYGLCCGWWWTPNHTHDALVRPGDAPSETWTCGNDSWNTYGWYNGFYNGWYNYGWYDYGWYDYGWYNGWYWGAEGTGSSITAGHAGLGSPSWGVFQQPQLPGVGQDIDPAQLSHTTTTQLVGQLFGLPQSVVTAQSMPDTTAADYGLTPSAEDFVESALANAGLSSETEDATASPLDTNVLGAGPAVPTSVTTAVTSTADLPTTPTTMLATPVRPSGNSCRTGRRAECRGRSGGGGRCAGGRRRHISVPGPRAEFLGRRQDRNLRVRGFGDSTTR